MQKIKHYNVHASTGFTLAEVLVTLIIIGVISALTIPTLVNNTYKAEFVTRLKKTYSVLQQAFDLVAMDSGGSILYNSNFSCSDECATTASANALNAFAAKLNILRNCGTSTGCLEKKPLKTLGGAEIYSNMDLEYDGIFGKAKLTDGSIMIVNIYDTRCTTTAGSAPPGSPLYGKVCGDLDYDVNGARGPNRIGRDIFDFWITQTGIYPQGSFNDDYTCEVNSSDWETSAGCAYKVLTEGDMNY